MTAETKKRRRRAKKREPRLECSSCHAIIRNADDLGYGFRGTPHVGDTHVCDRFQYGTLRKPRRRAAANDR